MALYIDNVYVGGTPLTIDIAKGDHDFLLQREFFEPIAWREPIGSRLFGSLLFPKKVSKEFPQTLNAPTEFTQQQYRSVSQWALVDEFSDRYHYPPVITETVQALLAVKNGPFIAEAQEFLTESQRQLALPEIQDDYHKAMELLENLGYTVAQQTYTSQLQSSEIQTTPIRIQEMQYIELTTPHMGTYAILDHEVTNGEYSKFLEENPFWRADNKEKLIEQGLVDTHYLQEFATSNPNLPVSYVSWHAVQAYAAWLNSTITSHTIEIPTEEEWLLVARACTKEGNFSYDLVGSLWEWTANDYAPLDGTTTPYGGSAESALKGVEMALRGGSYVDNQESISPASRGSHPPQWCTPVVGFRVVARQN